MGPDTAALADLAIAASAIVALLFGIVPVLGAVGRSRPPDSADPPSTGAAEGRTGRPDQGTTGPSPRTKYSYATTNSTRAVRKTTPTELHDGFVVR